jgi:coenzyme F420-reducing hydrogenase delta subunit
MKFLKLFGCIFYLISEMKERRKNLGQSIWNLFQWAPKTNLRILNRRCKMRKFLAITAVVAPLLLQAQELEVGRVRVKVMPNPAVVVPGGSVHFSAEVRDSLGNPLAAEIKWQVVPKKLGKIAPNGLFLASKQGGKGIVRAIAKTSQGKGVGHAFVRIRREGPHQGMLVKVTPTRTFVKLGATRQFKVEVFGPDGEPIQDAHIIFKVVPQNMGTITQEGEFKAGNEYGKCRIIALAKKGELEGVGEAVVLIGHPGKYLPVKIRPKHTILEPGETQKFDFEILGPPPEGEAEVEAKWKVVPKDLGTITSDGTFTASKKGKGFIIVIVKSGEKIGADRAVVIVGKPRRIRVKIYPKRAFVEPNMSFKFYVETFDAQGNPVELPIKWLVRPKEAGTIAQDGVFIAGKRIGKCEVIARIPPQFGIGEDKARVIIQKRYRVVVRPKMVSMKPKESQKFEAQVFDKKGNPVDVPVKWIVRPKDKGTIGEDGVFVAGEKLGRCEVIALVPPKFGVGRGIAKVLIHSGRKFKVKIHPKRVRISTGESKQFTAKVTDENGNPVEVKLIWRVKPRRAGTIDPNGLFTAGEMPGKCAVIVLVDPREGVGRDVAEITITQ